MVFLDHLGPCFQTRWLLTGSQRGLKITSSPQDHTGPSGQALCFDCWLLEKRQWCGFFVRLDPGISRYFLRIWVPRLWCDLCVPTQIYVFSAKLDHGDRILRILLKFDEMPNDLTIWPAGSDGNFMLWDLGTGQCCRYLPISTTVLCLAVDAQAERCGNANSRKQAVSSELLLQSLLKLNSSERS